MDVKERIIAELTAARDRSFGLTVGALDDPELPRQHSPLMSPLVWDLAHIGNYEELWLLRAAAGPRPDAARTSTTSTTPSSIRGPTGPRCRCSARPRPARYVAARARQGARLARRGAARRGDPLLDDGFVYGMVVQHEHQHDETMLATLQLRTRRRRC